jgi:hypothetical protein
VSKRAKESFDIIYMSGKFLKQTALPTHQGWCAYQNPHQYTHTLPNAQRLTFPNWFLLLLRRYRLLSHLFSLHLIFFLKKRPQSPPLPSTEGVPVGSFQGRHVLKVAQFSRKDLHYLFSVAHEMRVMVKRTGSIDLLKVERSIRVE